MHITLHLLMEIKDDKDKLEEFVRLHNLTNEAKDSLFEFYCDFFNDYSYCCPYSEALLDEVNKEYDEIGDEFENFINKNTPQIFS